MKNNEWNIPSDYFEKNKKALMPVRNFPKGKWLLALAAACFVGIGLFMWKGEGQVQEVATVEEKNEKQNVVKNEKQNENENEGKRGEEKGIEGKIGEDKRGEEKGREGKNEKQNENENEEKRGEEKVKEGKRKEEIAEDLKEIPREELVYYLLEQDSELIENLN
jgi:uncharacterized membrane protein